jgi:elongation factor Ts
MVEGRIKKFKKEICLLDQPFVKDPDKTVQDLVTDKIATIGEKISIRRFVRYEMGEGLEKRQDDFAREVAEQAKK